MKRVWIVLLLAVAAMAAQDAKKAETRPRGPVVQKLFVLKYADPNQIEMLLRVFDARLQQSSELHAITVEASPDSMRAIEDAIQKLDVPSAAPKDVEMTIFLLVATDSSTPVGAAIPRDVDSVVTQLKNTFPFKNYGLLDTIDFQTRTGRNVRTSSAATLPVAGRQEPVNTSLAINSIALENDGHTLRVERLNADFRIPVPTGAGNEFNYANLSLQTDLDIKEGQKVVVGRLGFTHDQALFLVMMGRIL